MIKSLRKKFVFVAMLSTLAVLTAIMGTVNIVNYVRMAKKADEMTALLAQNDGQFPRDFMKGGNLSEGEKKPDMENDLENGSYPESGQKGGMRSEDNSKSVLRPVRPEGLSPETPYETRFFFVSLDKDGNIIATDTEHIAAVDEESAEAYVDEIYSAKQTTGYTGIYRYRIAETGSGTCYIFLDCQKEITGFRNILLISISVSILGLLAVLALVMFFSRLVFRPVEESLVKQKQFITNASHELKTPLTIIDANTEVIAMENGESEWTKSNRKQIQRLTSLTEQLVTLTRLDEDRGAGEKTEFCISDALAESAESCKALALTQGKNLDFRIEEGIYYTGNEKSIRQMLGILLDNALKYSPEGGRIQAVLDRRGKKIHLEMENDTEEIPKGRLDILFERFYRLDNSRNSETGGSGIGLSVAKAIVQSHKGKISAYSKDGKSLNITVTL